MPQLSPMNWIILSAMPLIIIKTLMLAHKPLKTTSYMTNKNIKTFLYNWMW